MQPPRRSRKGITCLGCLGLVFVIGIIGAVAGAHSTTSSTPMPAVAPLQTLATLPAPAQAAPAATAAAAQTLTYRVTGSPADVTYGPTGTSVSGTVPLDVSGPLGNPLYYAVSAQLQGSGSVTCEILINGSVISQATASGGYNIADCEISKDPLSGAWTDTNAG